MNIYLNRRTGRPGHAIFLLLLLILSHNVLFAQGDSSAAGKPRPMSWKDIPSWKYISPQRVELSPDGQWLAWPLQTTEGDGELILKSTKDTVTRKLPLGGDNQPSFQFSEDGQWIAVRQ